MALNAIFIIAELTGAAADRIREIQAAFDPKLASGPPPHITIAGSSGVGPMRPTPPAEIRAALEPIAESTAPIEVQFGTPIRFMQTNIVVLPLDPHGALRTLHERIARSGLPFERPRFAFTPHSTLSFYPTHPADVVRRILAQRVTDAAVIDRIAVYHTRDPQPAMLLVELPLRGAN
jgi:2'-5' RNA ligase